VREIGYRAFNNCIELRHLTFAEGSEVRKVGGVVHRQESLVLSSNAEGICSVHDYKLNFSAIFFLSV
jgi:hypothetical protein